MDENNYNEEKGKRVRDIFIDEINKKGINPLKIFNKNVSNYERWKEIVLCEFFMAEKTKGTNGWLGHDNYSKIMEALPLIKSGEIELESVLTSTIISSISRFFIQGKFFSINKELMNLLINTKNKLYFRHSPFLSCLIECNFEPIKDVEIINILLMEGISCRNSFNDKIKKGDSLLNYCIIGVDWRDKTDWYLSGTLLKNGITKNNERRGIPYKLTFKKEESNLIEQKAIEYLCNFLDFLNHPEVETRIIKFPFNEERIKKGRLPIPDRVIIEIKGKLYRYIYEEYPLQKEQHKSPSYSFEVRGHYIHFWNKKRWHLLYSMDLEDLKEKNYQIDNNGIISKWIFPYIKGKGILKNKIYKLKKDGRTN